MTEFFFFKPTILWSGKEVQLLLFPGKAMRLLAILMFCKSYLRSWLREPLSNTYLSLKNSDLHCQGYLNHSRNSPRLTELVCNFELHPTIVCKRQKLFHEQNDVDTPLFFLKCEHLCMNGSGKVAELFMLRWLLKVTDALLLCVCYWVPDWISMASLL